MRFFSRAVLTTTILAAFGVSSAQASVYYWQSSDKRLEVSFPDSWKRVNNQLPNDILTLVAPGQYDYATCKISKTEDERFKIYPARYSQNIQKLYVSKDMWQSYFDSQINPVIHEVRDHVMLGYGDASMVYASYETASGPKMIKRALGFASLYGENLYKVECSAQEAAYSKWHSSFLSFMRGVNLLPPPNHAVNGYYRNFIGDSDLHVKGDTVFNDTYR